MWVLDPMGAPIDSPPMVEVFVEYMVLEVKAELLPEPENPPFPIEKVLDPIPEELLNVDAGGFGAAVIKSAWNSVDVKSLGFGLAAPDWVLDLGCSGD